MTPTKKPLGMATESDMNKSFIESTFHSINDYYADPWALAIALSNAESELRNKNKELKELEKQLAVHERHIAAVKESLDALGEVLGSEQTFNRPWTSMAPGSSVIKEPDLTSEAMAAVRAAIYATPGIYTTEIRIQVIQQELGEATMLVKMLEGVKAVSDVGGIKRAAPEPLEKETDHKQPRNV